MPPAEHVPAGDAPAVLTPAAPAPPLSLCVYCGSRPGVQPAYAELAQQLGRAIGRRGWQLVYGGGRVGLMGLLADATMAAGGRVVGVIPESLVQREVSHQGLHALHVVQTMHQRKQLMAEQAQAFVALPGGIGTFEELFEAWTWRHLRYHQRPLVLLDVNGYWQPLLHFLQHSVEQGFVDAQQMAMLQLADAVEPMLDTLAQQIAAQPGSGDGAAADLGRI